MFLTPPPHKNKILEDFVVAVYPSFSGKRARLDPKKKCKNSRLILLDVDKDQGLTIRDNRGGGAKF